MTNEEFRDMVEEEAALFDRFGMTALAERMRACTTLQQAVDVHKDAEALIRVAQIARRQGANVSS